MLLGSRVVRGPDWQGGEEDGGEGCVGTIISLGEFEEGVPLYRGTVKVRWDVGYESTYRAFHGENHDLRILDYSPTGLAFTSTACDFCGSESIRGLCWHCTDCLNVNLCTNCYMDDKHVLHHTFSCKQHENDNGQIVGRRSECQRYQANGIFPGARVALIDTRNNDIGLGTVLEQGMSDEETTKFGECYVSWDGVDFPYVHKLGRDGEVELQLAESFDGPMYYKDHLPVVEVDEDQLYVGDKVCIHLSKCVQVLREALTSAGFAPDQVKELEGEIGEVYNIDSDGMVFVEYKGLQIEKWNFKNAQKMLSKVPKLSKGDTVRLTDNIEALEKLQTDEHKGFNQDMEKDLDHIGKVLDIDKGTAKVKFPNSTWWINRAALERVDKIMAEAMVLAEPKKESVFSENDPLRELGEIVYKTAMGFKSVLEEVHKNTDVEQFGIVLDKDKGTAKVELPNNTLLLNRTAFERVNEVVADAMVQVEQKKESVFESEPLNELAEAVYKTAMDFKSVLEEVHENTVKAIEAENNEETKTHKPALLETAEDSVPVEDPKQDVDSFLAGYQAAQENRHMSEDIERIYSGCWKDDPDSIDVYRMKSNPRGLMIIINIRKFVVDPSLPDHEKLQKDLVERTGSEKDVTKLKDLFGGYLQFKVHVVNPGRNRHELLTELTVIANKPEYKDYDCFALCIMSHGKGSEFYNYDGRTIKTSAIFNMFSNSRCENYCGKPKLFFIQACRGELQDEKRPVADGPMAEGRSDSFPSNDMADMLLGYSSFEDYPSFRDPEEGSFFIQSLVSVFEEYADKEDILHMMTKVNDQVYSSIHGSCGGLTQVPAPTHTLRKKLYFWPGTIFDEDPR